MSTEVETRAPPPARGARPIFIIKLRPDARVEVPEKVAARLDGSDLVVKGPLGELRRRFPVDALGFELRDGEVTFSLKLPVQRRESQALLGTWERHFRNMLTGVTRGFEARLKSVHAHFPMKVQVRERTLVIENFLGEKYPRSAPLLSGVNAKVEGDLVTLSGIDIEAVGQCAANIERATRIRDYDPRVFQDGIYIVDRAHPKEGS
jgi:large subunit ribosomal protein L6